MELTLQYVDPGPKGETRRLELNGKRVVMRTADGTVIWHVSALEACDSFRMPGLADRSTRIGIVLGKRIHHFDVSQRDMRRLERFRDQTMLARRPEAVRKVRNRAIGFSLVGASCAISGGMLALNGDSDAAQALGGAKFVIVFGLVVASLILLSVGIRGFIKHGQIQHMPG